MTDMKFNTPYRTRVSIGSDGSVAIVQERKTGDRPDVVLLHGAEAQAMAEAILDRHVPQLATGG